MMLSSLGYQIVNLSGAQLEKRRNSLDGAGSVAWISPIVITAAIYNIRKNFGRFGAGSGTVSPSAPPTAFQAFWRKISWTLNSPLTAEFGSVKVHLVGFIYLAWLVSVSFLWTGDDYMHLTKRFGHVAISQLPFQYLLAMKSPFNPLQDTLGLSHEELNDYHRLFGRIVHLLLAVHAILYLRFFVLAGLLSKRVQDRDVQLGLAAVWTVSILAVLAIPTIRKKVYHKVFYRSHVVLTTLLLPILYFHVPYTRMYIWQAAAIQLLNAGLRIIQSSEKLATVIDKVGTTGLLKLKIHDKQKNMLKSWVPGQHVYIKQGLGPLAAKTPFTVSDLSEADGKREIHLLVRNMDGPQTGWLSSRRRAELYVEGPYGGVKHYMPELINAKERAGQIMLVAGGVGVSYTLPIYLVLMEQVPSRKDVCFIWIVRKGTEVQMTELLKQVPQLAETKITVSEGGKSDYGRLGLEKTIFVFGGRPILDKVVDAVFDSPMGPAEKKARNYSAVNVLVCGPPALSRALRKAVGRQVTAHGIEVFFHEEQFGLGSE